MNLPRLGVLALAFALTVGCTTTDPYTGQTQVDETATAGAVAGLALLGAAAYAVSKDKDDNDDDDDYRYRNHRYYDDDYRSRRHRDRGERGVYYPQRGVTCYRYKRSCYRDGHYSSKWTRREFG